MPSKEFLCKKCRDMHKRPINSKCPFGSPQSLEFDSENVTVPGVSGVSVRRQCCFECSEDRMARSGKQEVAQRSNASGTLVAAASTSDSSWLEQVVVPSVAALQGTSHIQAEVDRHIGHLTDLNEASKLKS